MGTPEGSPIEVRNAQGQKEYAKDTRGNVIITKVDITGLHRIADTTNGQFFMITPNNAEIFDILRIIQDNEKTKHSTHQFFRFKEQFHIFLILALFFFIIESFVNYKNIPIKRRLL